MKFTIKPLKGDNFEVEVEDQGTVLELKKAIGELKSEFPSDLQKLIYSGRILKDENKVAEIGVKEGEFIVVMAAKAKAPAAPSAPAAAPAAATPAAPAATPAPASDGAADPAAAAAANLVTGSGMEATVTQLMDMGFPRPDVERCLMAAFNNPDRAVEYLMNGIPEGILQAEGAGGGAPGGGAGTPGGAAPGGGAPPASGGPGNTAAFPAMTGGGGGGGGVEIPPVLQQLRTNPQFAQVANLIRTNPQMLAQILPALQAQQPELVQAIQENPQAFMQLIQESGEGDANDPVAAMLAAAQGGGGGAPGGAPGAGGAPPGQMVIRLTEEEAQAVARLEALGFDRASATQAFLACDKNEELAANFLFDMPADMTD